MEKTKKQVEQEKSELQAALEEVEASVWDVTQGSSGGQDIEGGGLGPHFGAFPAKRPWGSPGDQHPAALGKQLCSAASSPGVL